MRHPRLSVDHVEVEKLGQHGFTTCMCLLCIDGLLRFGTCCPVQLVFIHCSTNCSPCYIRLVVMAVSIPAPLGLSLVLNRIIYCFTEHEASPSATDPDHTPKALLL